MLVHMAPEEVAGLQALALKHGGTLTINPETGLAEAGFLKKILPMVAGFALGPAGFGLMSSAMAGLTVGGITALSSGSLEKGLMAGLGAYGGSGLGESLMGAGTGALSSAAGNTAASGVTQAVPVAATEAIGTTAAQNAASAIPAGAANTVSQTAVDAFGSTIPNPAFSPIQTVTQAPALSQSAADIGNAYAQEQAAQNAVANKLATSTPMDRLGAGYNAVTSSSDAALKFAKNNMMPLGALGLAALSSDDKTVAKPNDPGMIRPYTYSRTKVPGAFDRTPNDPMSSRERQYFNDQYTALTPYRAPGPEYALAAAEGGIVPFASGGPVEAMSDANAIGMNTGYPQSGIRTGAYATPDQQPSSRDMLPYPGQPQFADGGSVGGYTFDPRTGLYTKPGGQGATTVSPIGELSGGTSGSSGSSGDNSLNYVNPNVAKETFEEQSARNQKLNDFLTEVLPTVLSPFSTMARGLYDTPIAGGIANFFSPPGSQPNYGVPVDNMGTYAGMPAMGQTSYESGVGNPAEGGGHVSDTSGSGGYSQSAGENVGGEGPSGDGVSLAQGGLSALAQGGMSNLGDYSDGGRLLRGPGDGVSDSIPATIGQKQQARLADGEFVVPARIVSELGNGSTEAGARQLYAMMDRVQKARKKTVGKDKVATNSRAAKLLPA
jgi:hypothetical protein